MYKTLFLLVLMNGFSIQDGISQADTIRVDTVATDTSGMEYFIQIASLQSAFEKFPALQDLGYLFKIRHETKDLFRYQLGVYENREMAEKVLLIVRNRGFKDAFVVERPAFKGGG